MQCLDLIRHHRLVAIVRLDDLSTAVHLSRALLAAGVVAQEYTLTNPDALATIAKVLLEVPEFSNGDATLGVGSVRTPAQAQAAMEAGAQFVVTPIFQPDVVAYCVGKSIPVVSGAMTPTEIASAWQAGAALVKVFPARSLGPKYISDVLAPMPEIELMPTGGVGLDNMREYFDAGASAVGIGSNLFEMSALQLAQWDRIAEVAAEFASRAKKAVEPTKEN
ncbi:MAG: bifunctional 4-hydroxy-2-oxoglutarate aldolase/2-dehydro-3-deoxy-phosphogluconate aldolase [Planctomycetales bacterium]|nr:bifunctional 4-hydroxy-2-oxoglutarate aldolase/2-dehydro-3-deoxy-phosphogluconate aldolase [Planctomycetales bacterium]